MTDAEAMAFVLEQGVVLVSGKGPVPRLTEAVAGEPIKGSWWAHPRSHHIFAVLEAVTGSPDILTCRLVEGKVTLVHRRLWPALVRVADRFPPERVAQVIQEHTPAGHHLNREIPFPDWAPEEVRTLAQQLDEEGALNLLGPWARCSKGPERKIEAVNHRMCKEGA